MDGDYTWDMSGYYGKYSFIEDRLTMRQVERIFQLEPEPPKAAFINDYIVTAVAEQDYIYFSFFLHHYESRLNGRIRSSLLREGLDRYDPDRFLDYKMECILAMLERLPDYDPDKGADFLTYVHHHIGNALLTCRMREEGGSFSSLDEYKAVRGIAWLYNEHESEQEAIARYAEQNGCSETIAAEYLTVARKNRNQVPFYVTVQDEDSEETGEDVTRDDSWNYTDILWNGMQAKAVQAAFDKLSYREQIYLEKRNAICMTCGRVSPLSMRTTFDDLATMFEGSSASGAERAYHRALEKLTKNLVEAGALHVVELKRKSQRKKGKKIAAAVYEYRVDYDGEWGEVSFDFVQGTAEIVKLVEPDTVERNAFAELAICYILEFSTDTPPKKIMLPFSTGDVSIKID
ncbi:MAG: hypothetical protein LUF27_02510 [Lachnospiraceae bacterium]|nr:hypothetical protein [Lachnospiraceae bacterium]